MFRKKEKVPVKDFTPADLPDNRYQQFVDIFKQRLLGLLTLNGIYLLFMLPLLIMGALFLIMVNGAVTAGKDIKEILAYLIYLIPIGALLYTLVGPAKAGVYYVLRKWSWAEHAESWRDFWREWKRSWKKGMLVNFLLGLFVNALFFWGMTLLYQESMNKTFAMVLLGILVVFALFTLLANQFVWPLMVTFNLSFKQLVKNAYVLALLRLPATLLLVVGMGLFVYLVGVIWQLVLFLFGLFGFVALFLADVLYCNSVFDKFQEALTDEPTEKRKGLSPKK